MQSFSQKWAKKASKTTPDNVNDDFRDVEIL